MRVAFGLVGILVTIGAMIWIFHAVEGPSIQQSMNIKKKVEPQVQQMAGKDASGFDARESIKLADESHNGKLTGVLVTAITDGGAMEKYFGLKRGDVITEISEGGEALMPVSGMSSASEAKDALLTAYQNSQHIVVVRNEQKVNLPAAAAPTGQPTNAAKGSGDELQHQLDAIKGAR